jgi:hypothetical protein
LVDSLQYRKNAEKWIRPRLVFCGRKWAPMPTAGVELPKPKARREVGNARIHRDTGTQFMPINTFPPKVSPCPTPTPELRRAASGRVAEWFKALDSKSNEG